MSLIVFKVKAHLNRWDVIHNEVALATFDTRAAAERSALAIAARHPPKARVEIDTARPDGSFSEIRVY